MTRGWRIALGIVVWLSLIGGLTIHAAQENEAYRHGHQQAKQIGNENIPSSAVFGWLAGWDSNRTTALATAIMAVFTVILGLIAIRQARDARILQRAYISVEPLGLSPWRGSTALFLAHVSVRNTGNLPARELSWVMHMEQGADGDRTGFPITGQPRGKHVLTSGSAMTRGSRPQHVDPIVRSEWYCFVWGRIDYEDGFGKKRCTKFCHRYNLAMPHFVTSRSITAENAREHDDGNDAT